jgi:putative transposase
MQLIRTLAAWRPDLTDYRSVVSAYRITLKSLGRRYLELIDYQAELRRRGILISMSGTGNCYDNAMVETFSKTLKSELVWRIVFYTRQEADQVIGRYIDGFYNPVRRHSALDFTSPAQFEKTAAE